jgi:hypothetical protein
VVASQQSIMLHPFFDWTQSLVRGFKSKQAPREEFKPTGALSPTSATAGGTHGLNGGGKSIVVQLLTTLSWDPRHLSPSSSGSSGGESEGISSAPPPMSPEEAYQEAASKLTAAALGTQFVGLLHAAGAPLLAVVEVTHVSTSDASITGSALPPLADDDAGAARAVTAGSLVAIILAVAVILAVVGRLAYALMSKENVTYSSFTSLSMLEGDGDDDGDGDFELHSAYDDGEEGRSLTSPSRSGGGARQDNYSWDRAFGGTSEGGGRGLIRYGDNGTKGGASVAGQVGYNIRRSNNNYM